jgi:CBS-domain-containing membrane protein
MVCAGGIVELNEYFSKMKGGAKVPPRVPAIEIFWSFVGVVVGVGLCAFLSSFYFEPRDLSLLVGSLGASSVLVYAASKSHFSQPRNVIGGHVLSGLIGVTCFLLFGEVPWLAEVLAVSFATIVMLMTKTMHPPGGATALIAVIGDAKIHSLGYLYPFLPAGAGALVLVLVAVIVNNLTKNRKYPEYWF